MDKNIEAGTRGDRPSGGIRSRDRAIRPDDKGASARARNAKVVLVAEAYDVGRAHCQQGRGGVMDIGYGSDFGQRYTA